MQTFLLSFIKGMLYHISKTIRDGKKRNYAQSTKPWGVNLNDVETMSLLLPTSYLHFLFEKTYFHIFLPITEQKEVDTELILHLLSGKDKEIIISKLILIVLRWLSSFDRQ
jgi:hypothetical protein